MAAVRFSIHGRAKDGSGDAYRDLAGRMTGFVKENEPGTTRYDWYLADDGATLNVDHYADSDALGTHLGNAQEQGFLDDFMATIDIEGVHVIGQVDDAAREMLAPFGPVYYEQVQSL